jgi:hypothetical protein
MSEQNNSLKTFKKWSSYVGWGVFLIATIVYLFSAERTGSLWDCGEFISGAQKLQVVHPPGAALFLLIGRIFTVVAELISDNPEDIAFSVNLLSGICTAFAAAFVCWVTIILGRLAIMGREEAPDREQTIALLGAGVVAGLATAFCTSVWFSAVEGEVYAMSTFFTTLTLWSMMRWYELPDSSDADRWVVFTIYAAGLSIGVHLLSLLTFPALALFYYFKKYKNHTLKGMAIAAGIGVAFIVVIQSLIIVGIPTLWSYLDLFMVNSMGMPQHSGLIPLVIIVGGVIFFALRYAHQQQNGLLQKLIVALTLVVISFTTVGVVVIRANANTPINMNNPSDAMRLLPYLNREQYGERPLLYGPHFNTSIVDVKTEDRYGYVDGKYEIVDRKAEYEFDKNKQMLFPRMGHMDEARKALYKRWMGGKNSDPTMLDNLSFFFKYQINWMYVRYFMWNFAGRQNGAQGFSPDDKTSGNWLSGIGFIDSARLYDQSNLPSNIKNDQGRNTYYFLPLIFGLMGLFWHYKNNREDFMGLLALFIITGIGIIVYSNQPPNEPRERDYVLVGSFFTFCIWMGLGVVQVYELLKNKVNLKGVTPAAVALGLVLIAPILMGTQNFDDHSRRHHKGSRDYASNFLNSCEPNAIIFTYGDNDTYPLWYAQEVEGIRTDVRVVNLSLIAVDWYIEQLRRKVNDSPAIKMSLSSDALRGFKRVQVPVDPFKKGNPEKPLNVYSALKFVGEEHPLQTQSGNPLESYFPSKYLSLPVDRNRAVATGWIKPTDTTGLVNAITMNISKSYLLKGDLAVLDIVANNVWERPVYFAVTCRQESLLGLQDYTQLEGLALRIVPFKNQGDRLFGMIGNGRVNTQAVYDNIMNKFRWGNFDQQELFVDRSYGPTIQTTRYTILRAARELMQQGQQEKAANLVKKYFEAFPNMNFTYDPSMVLFLDILVQAGDLEAAKKELRTLANVTKEYLDFFNTLTQEEIRGGFEGDMNSYSQVRGDILRLAAEVKDPTYESEIKALLGESEPLKD